ncbi:MAG TPA: hypothetical protein VMG08_21835 [Allosphingosinicella sp.]|nr:hypothetical protein [Allosphingosinicella sp.]
MDKKLVVVIGGIVLVIGLFLPIVSSGGQSFTYLSRGGEGIEWSGIVLIACGALGAILGLLNQAKHAVWLGIVALGIVVWRFLQTKGALDDAGAAIPSGIELPPELAAQLPAINFLGWGVLGLGAVILLVGGAMAWKGSSSAA